MSSSVPVNPPSRLELARLPTPLTPLERFSAQFAGTRIWVKHDEQTGTELSGNKVRKLEFTLAEARRQGCDTVITCGGVQSNHCRATAVLGARLGLRVHLILRGEQPASCDGNLLLDWLTGASIQYLSQAEWYRHPEIAAALQERLGAEGWKAWFIPTGASDEAGLWGYIEACRELAGDFAHHRLQPDAIVTATGSGGTQGGLVLGNALYGLDTQVLAINVCDDARYFHDKIREDTQRWLSRYAGCMPPDIDYTALPIRTIEGYVGPGYGRAERPVFELIGELARSEGVILDPVYTGKAFHGLVNEIRRGALQGARDIVFIHTGGLFGLFPQKEQLAEATGFPA